MASDFSEHSSCLPLKRVAQSPSLRMEEDAGYAFSYDAACEDAIFKLQCSPFHFLFLASILAKNWRIS